MFSYTTLLCSLVAFAALFHDVYSFLDTSSSSTVAVYWGQNSGNTGQQRLGFYCDNPNIDVFQISFVTRISGAGALPEVNFANQEAGCTVYPGTNLLNCPQIGEDIKQCQQKGKTILLSIGGATTSERGFASDAAAIEAANKMWEVFGPVQAERAAYRPFGDAVIDGFDFNFETTVTNMVPFANQLRSLMDGAGGKRYFLTAAPQCVFPDVADQEMLNGAVAFDAIWVQFYNNFCGANAFAFGKAPQGAFNFDLWDGWAKSQSKNKQVKVFIGLPASAGSARSGFVAAAQLHEVVQWSKAFSSFGGVMLWDASSIIFRSKPQGRKEEASAVHPVKMVEEETEPGSQRVQGQGWWRRSWKGRQMEDPESVRNQNYRAKSTLGILSDKHTDEVPGTVLLLSSNRNEPLGLRHQPQRTSASSLPNYPSSRSSSRTVAPVPKKTSDGQIVLNPQPDDSVNDPLNWPVWRRDAALLSLGFYCLMGGGMTPVLAAGFNQVAESYGVSTQKVAYTTGLYMLGLGIGSVIMSPTAILWGKRPVYLLGATLFVLSAVWCALSPNYPSLVVARIFQGIAVSPVECLPSATIAEIYFLHERAYRIGIYTLLLLGGKNLVPLVSAAIIGRLGWEWVFWIVAIVVGSCLVLLFFFVPETFWDRTPRPRRPHKRPHVIQSVTELMSHGLRGRPPHQRLADAVVEDDAVSPAPRKSRKLAHVGFVENEDEHKHQYDEKERRSEDRDQIVACEAAAVDDHPTDVAPLAVTEETDTSLPVPAPAVVRETASPSVDLERGRQAGLSRTRSESLDPVGPLLPAQQYTNRLREKPQVPFTHYLRPWNGRISHDKWWRVAVRPFILFAYPAVLWSTVVYSLSVGWLIVLSESVAHLYQGEDAYNFTPLQTGLIYISPFVGGLLGTAVAGKVSDIIVRYMTRRNGGVYEPEFRLVMAIPIGLSTTAGLMAFGWSTEVKDSWIVPTIFFGLISFGCCLGSTTSITFCVDSYRQYAGEALVTLNWSKNVFHGLVFSLFIVDWLDANGARTVFLALGGIQLGCLLFSIPMYIYGKRARMWTVRTRLMEKF
ncbi:putative MFS transporter [Aspergillus clavatus NRRL 1]|uniref:MFS transporter, putative n=1 Tax=Aspergillus clavatus (strain ATCC 1007 / CBS 513.65 / DSM 816 / NCTC 3887 / NRRL 1 / QM 1276 / 107) TaxID=344612 RepID=A1CJH8_ASPCL|nr:MFS transporter, putative [Aspergillus clavatus NRRL 1]EAW09302.1 MFS transporter, putative [Aspergillus clavatus NRRL 1]